jgi:hypothetical protein
MFDRMLKWDTTQDMISHLRKAGHDEGLDFMRGQGGTIAEIADALDNEDFPLAKTKWEEAVTDNLFPYPGQAETAAALIGLLEGQLETAR